MKLLKIWLIAFVFTSLFISTTPSYGSKVHQNQSQNDAGSGQDAPGVYVSNGRDQNPIDICKNTLAINLDTVYQAQIGSSLKELNGDLEDSDDCYSLGAMEAEGYLKSTISIQNFEEGMSFIVSHLYQHISENHVLLNSHLSSNLQIHYEIMDNVSMMISVPIILFDDVVIRFNNIWGFDILNYQFSISFTPSEVPLQDEGGFGQDAPDAYSTDFPTINFDTQYEGQFGSGLVNDSGLIDWEDYYQFEITEQGYLTLHLTQSSFDEFYLIFESVNRLKDPSLPSVGISSDEPLKMSEPGIYLISFHPWVGQATASDTPVFYSFNLTFIEFSFATQQDGLYEKDAPSSNLWETNQNSVEHRYNTSYQGNIGTSLSSYEYSNDTKDGYFFQKIRKNFDESFRIKFRKIEQLDSNDEVWIRLKVDFCQSGSSGLERILYVSNVSNEFSSIPIQLSEHMPLGGCDTTDSNLHLSMEYTGEFLKYELEVIYFGDQIIDPLKNDENIGEELVLNNANYFFIFSGLIVSIILVGYLSNGKFGSLIGNSTINITKQTKSILEETFNGKSSRVLVLAQNLTGKKNLNKLEIEEDFPPELLREKFLLHPVRLGIMKVLLNKYSITSSELSSKLGISWGEFSSHKAALMDKGYIRLEEQFIEDNVKQVVIIESLGIEKFQIVAELLKEFLQNK